MMLGRGAGTVRPERQQLICAHLRQVERRLAGLTQARSYQRS
jgi:hypothetical protein